MPGRLAVVPTHGDSGQLTIHGSLAIGRAEIGGTTDQNGDFNYDGKINVDDYGIIDFNIGIQGAPFSTASQPLGAFANATAPVAVPEPTAGALLGAIGWSFSLRQRRRSLSADHNSDRGSGRSHAMGQGAQNG